MVGAIAIPHGAEGIAVTPDGETLFVCAHWKGVVHVFDTRTHTLRRTIAIEGAPGEANQLRRVRVSPDGRYVCASSHVDNFAAVYESATLKQIGGFDTPKAPMGFGFAAVTMPRLRLSSNWRAAGSRGNFRPRRAANSSSRTEDV
jgi:DNA-binding beta-propeller fold protein YncE